MLIFAVPNSLIILFVLIIIFAFIVLVVKSLISGCLTLIKTLIKSYKENEKTRLAYQLHLLSLACLMTLIVPFIIFIFDYPLYYFFLDIAVLVLLGHLNEKWKARAKKANITQEAIINANEP